MRRLAALILFGANLLAWPPAFGAASFIREQEMIPERGMVERITLIGASGVRLSIIPPAEWRMRLDAERASIQFQSQVGSVVLEIQYSPEALPKAVDKFEEACRATLLSESPGAKVTEKFDAFTTAGSGIGFGYEVPGSAGAVLQGRTAWVRLEHGTLVLSLKGAGPAFTSSYNSWVGILNSIRCSLPVVPPAK